MATDDTFGYVSPLDSTSLEAGSINVQPTHLPEDSSEGISEIILWLKQTKEFADAPQLAGRFLQGGRYALIFWLDSFTPKKPESNNDELDPSDGKNSIFYSHKSDHKQNSSPGQLSESDEATETQ